MIAGPWRRIPPPRSHVSSEHAAAAPDRERFTFFWRGPFSQWYPSKFEIDGIVYSHAEQWMMAEKARLFDDEAVLKEILVSSNPKEQKALGRKVKGSAGPRWNSGDEARWNDAAKGIVMEGSRAKFSQNADLLGMLLATEGTTLVEASPYDRIWGIGLAESDLRAHSRETWLGKNWLGEVLTEVRDALLLEMSPSQAPR